MSHCVIVLNIHVYTYWQCRMKVYSFFFFNDTATTEIYTLSLHDALPIFAAARRVCGCAILHSRCTRRMADLHGQRHHAQPRSEEHTSELQSPCNLVCRLLLEKKKTKTRIALRVISIG